MMEENRREPHICIYRIKKRNNPIKYIREKERKIHTNRYLHMTTHDGKGKVPTKQEENVPIREKNIRYLYRRAFGYYQEKMNVETSDLIPKVRVRV